MTQSRRAFLCSALSALGLALSTLGLARPNTTLKTATLTFYPFSKDSSLLLQEETLNALMNALERFRIDRAGQFEGERLIQDLHQGTESGEQVPSARLGDAALPSQVDEHPLVGARGAL